MLRTVFALAFACMSSAIAHGSATVAVWQARPHEAPVHLYTLTSGAITVRITDFGARIVSIEAPDRSGRLRDIVLGYDSAEAYEDEKGHYFGAVVGRYANRIANGTFPLEGKTYHIPLNKPPNAMHGGPVGFDHRMWQGRVLGNGVELSLSSPDGDQGFPGRLSVRVRYLLDGNTLRIVYDATSDKPTIVNLTNHSYFDLAGQSSGTVLSQTIRIDADRFTPVDAAAIPTGESRSVAETPFDLRKAVAIGAHLDERNQQLLLSGGYDHNFVLNGANGSLHFAAQAEDAKSGRVLTVRTTEPGLQFYSGNFLDGRVPGKGGFLYQKHAAFCLETQHFPDSPNHPTFPSTELRPGHSFHSETDFTFSTTR
jgi:aldose 1-epimerase